MKVAMAVGSVSSSRRATVRVGETWKDEEIVEPCASTAAELDSVCSFSFALPPIALGASCVLSLLLMKTPRPIPPAIAYQVMLVTKKRVVRKSLR